MAGTRSVNQADDFADDIVPWLEETGTPFRYDPIEDNAIRLLELEPSLPQDPIRCKLIHVSLDDSPQYEILSCDWPGTAKPQVPISLNGRTFDVPSETWAALHRVRSEDRAKLFWTDAICINQRLDGKDYDTDNTGENNQLSRLREIYQNATGLLVWLGSTEDNSHLVFEHLDRCRYEHKHLNWCHYRGETDEAFQHLSRRSWFYRTQSAQELALTKAATILCGRYQSEWPDLMRCTSFPSTQEYYHPLNGPDGRTHLHHLRELSRWRRVQLGRIFLWNRHCRTDDPRDKIFSALMLDTRARFDIPIDYRQDLIQLYQAFTRKVIESSQSLEVLQWLGPQRRRIGGLPSWVPDYSVVNPVGTLPRVFGASASYSIQYPLRLLPEFEFRPGGILAVHGRLIEKIERLGDELEAKETVVVGSENFNSLLSGWENLALSLTKKRFPQAIIDAFADTLVGNDEADLVVETDNPPYIKKSRPSSSPVADQFHIWYKQYGTGALEKADPAFVNDEPCKKESREVLNETGRKHLEKFSRRMEMTCYGRKFFTTDKGSMGLAPPCAREGDDLVFLPGGKYPFVLRPREDDTYELIGDCFLYDLDVFALFQDQDTATREFALI